MPTLSELNTLVSRSAALRDNGSRAALRRALGRPLEEAPAALPLVAAALPGRPDPAIDDAVLLTAAAAATWPDLHRSRIGLGAALAATGGSTADNRLVAAARASSDLLCQRHLPDLLRIIHKAGGHIDLAILGLQAAHWPASQEETARRWLRDYYRAATSTSRSMPTGSPPDTTGAPTTPTADQQP